MNENESRVVGHVGSGVKVAVEAVETSFGPESAQYAARMAAATEGDVDVYAARTDVKTVEGFG